MSERDVSAQKRDNESSDQTELGDQGGAPGTAGEQVVFDIESSRIKHAASLAGV